MPAKRIQISKDDLYREYVQNKKTVAQCAEFFGCSNGVILNRMQEHGIDARHRGGHPKKLDTGAETNGKPTETQALKEQPEVSDKRSPKRRLLERLILLSSVKEMSIQELLEEALELLFEKYAKQ